MFDDNNDRNFYNWIVPFYYMDHFHVMDFIKDDLDFLPSYQNEFLSYLRFLFFLLQMESKTDIEDNIRNCFYSLVLQNIFKKLDNEELMNKLKTNVFKKNLKFSK